ncbi:MAG TPA: MFS transporter, partial [Gaiellaceae bacterium]|nr:MFS transporter [Gaiellaceae bacterium]
RTEAVPPERAQPVSALGRALRAPPVAAALWFVTLPGLLFGALSVLAPLRLSQLGFGALAIAATWMVSASLEALASPMLGHLSDRIGRRRPLYGSLAGAIVVLAVIPWPPSAYALAALVVCAGVAFGSFWTPAMALLSDAGEAQGLSHGYSFALMNLAWAPGQAVGAAVGGGVASATRDAVPYLALAGLCALTLAALWRSASSS